MLPSREDLIAKADALVDRPVAFEAIWDGDSSGWFVEFNAVFKTGDGYTSEFFAVLQDGGDIRVFNGNVPPWPEAEFARKIGAELASRFGVPFYFPSPIHPEEACPHWWEQHQGYPCRRCGILLLQHESCPWRGVCHRCRCEERWEQKEAAWTPEERASPRCHMCGNPGKGRLGLMLLCEKCLERYESFQCSRCGASGLILKTASRADVCHPCDLKAKLDQVSDETRRAIRIAVANGGPSAGIQEAIRLLGWELHDAAAAMRKFASQTTPL
jgi:hypothetical protein